MAMISRPARPSTIGEPVWASWSRGLTSGPNTDLQPSTSGVNAIWGQIIGTESAGDPVTEPWLPRAAAGAANRKEADEPAEL